MRKFSLFPVVICVGLSGCSIHPQTEDFSRSAVPDIIAAIKCEAQQAILAEIPDPRSYLIKTGLGLAFFFEMTESNDRTASANFTFPLSEGIFRIVAGAGLEKERKSTQRLTTADTFGDILELECHGGDQPPNYVYPITGNIGLGATFRNYVRIMQQHEDESLLGEFNDEVQFTTAIGKSLTPSIDLRPVSGRLIDARLTLADQRVDVHRVRLSFTVPSTEFQETAAQLKARKARLRELARIEEERRIPSLVQLLDKNGNVIDSFDDDGRPRVAPSGVRETPTPRARVQPPAAPEADADIRLRTLEDLERSERKAFEERFTREFEQ
jgi:hypothetical protein